MLEDKGILWGKEPSCFRHGTFIKRVQHLTPDGSIRYDFKVIDTELKKFNDEINQFLKCEVYVEKPDTTTPESASESVNEPVNEPANEPASEQLEPDTINI